MKRTLLYGAIGAVLSLSSVSNVMADVDLDASPVVAAKFAKELNVESSAVIGGSTENTLDLTAELGFGLGAGDTAFVRYDITSGNATFGGTAPTMQIGETSATPSSGGADGDTFAVFAVDTTIAVAGDAEVLLDMGNNSADLKVTDQNDVTVQYRLYDNATQAQSGGANTLKDVSGKWVEWANVIKLDITDKIQVPSVAEEFQSFKIDAEVPSGPLPDANSATGRLVDIGTLQIQVDGDVALQDGTPAMDDDIDVVLGTTSTLVINATNAAFTPTFDSTTADPISSAVFLSTADDCSLSTIPNSTTIPTDLEIAADGSSVTIKTDIPVATGQVNTDLFVCYLANGTTAIPDAAFTVSLVPAANSPYDAAPEDYAGEALGTFTRDGTTLEATFTTGLASASANRFTFSNSGTQTAPVTGITFYKANGQVATTADPATVAASLGLTALEIPANGVLNINRSALPAGGKSAVFTIGAQSNNIKGIYQLAPTASSPQMILQMVSPSGTN